MQAEPQHIARGREQILRQPCNQDGNAGVGLDQIPAPVHHQCRIGIVPGQDLADGEPHHRQLRSVQGLLRAFRCKASGKQQPIPATQRNIEVLGEPHHQVSAGRRAAVLDEAQVPGGSLGLIGKGHLRHIPRPAPVTQ